jgi:isopentenyldiphosphate isomerase
MKTKKVVVEHDSFDVLTEDGKRSGVRLPNTDVHARGLWHSSSHIWIYDGAGHVLLQRRSYHSWNYPGAWDISSAGHLSSGETALRAARRELKEELGIEVRPGQLQLMKIVRRAPWDTNYTQRHREYQHLYALHLPKDTEFKPNPLEVSGLRWTRLEELLKAAQDRAGKRYVPHGTYYQQVYHWLSKL